MVLSVCNGRPVPRQSYHVTLAFLGNCEAPLKRFDRLERIVIESATESAPGFELVLDRFGHWRRPRVLWIGPTRYPPALAGLVAGIRTGLDELDVTYDHRAFNAHVTLVRKVTVLPELPEPEPILWRVDEFALVESTTTPEGPVYGVVRRFPAGSRHEPHRH